MRFYGMSYWEAMDTPIRAFWELNRNVDRVAAEESARRLEGDLTAGSQSSEAVERYSETLRKQMGSVIVERAEFDRDGLHALKELGRGFC